MNILLNSDHELRSGWKFGLFVFIFLLVSLVSGILLSILFVLIRPQETDLALLAENVAVLAASGVLATLFMARFVEHAPLAAFGAGFHEYWKKDVLMGLGVSAGMLAVMAAGSAVFGGLTVQWTAPELAAGPFLFTLLLLLAAAANEELVFRGYPLQILMRGLGTWPAVAFMSILFGALHMNNPNATALGTVNTMIAGLMLSIAYLKTRSLWLPYAIHAGWNVGLGMVLGYPLSGIDIGSLWTSQTSGADIIVGGQYGPEGGFLATLIFGGTAIVVYRLRSAAVSPAMTALLAARRADKLDDPSDPAGVAAGGASATGGPR
jgi:membrane protease YdiL (CAAX protease family)